MFTLVFWKQVIERALKTAAQSAIGVLVTLYTIQEVDLGLVLGTAALATLLSVLTSIASSGTGDSESPSLVKTNTGVEVEEEYEIEIPMKKVGD